MLLLSLAEALNNAVEHGNRGDTSRPVRLDYLLEPGFALVSVRDDGTGFAPSFPDLPSVRGGRGRGLGLIQANADAVFFNLAANQITFLKGVAVMELTTKNCRARLNKLPGGAVLVTELDFADHRTAISSGLGELLEAEPCRLATDVFLDMGAVRLLSSMGWGTLFAHAEQPTLRSIVLFNVNEAVGKTAEQMGLLPTQGTGGKLRVYRECSEAIRAMAETMTAVAHG
jgi:hypothetical protein